MALQWKWSDKMGKITVFQLSLLNVLCRPTS